MWSGGTSKLCLGMLLVKKSLLLELSGTGFWSSAEDALQHVNVGLNVQACEGLIPGQSNNNNLSVSTGHYYRLIWIPFRYL